VCHVPPYHPADAEPLKQPRDVQIVIHSNGRSSEPVPFTYFPRMLLQYLSFSSFFSCVFCAGGCEKDRRKNGLMITQQSVENENCSASWTYSDIHIWTVLMLSAWLLTCNIMIPVVLVHICTVKVKCCEQSRTFSILSKFINTTKKRDVLLMFRFLTQIFIRRSWYSLLSSSETWRDD